MNAFVVHFFSSVVQLHCSHFGRWDEEEEEEKKQRVSFLVLGLPRYTRQNGTWSMRNSFFGFLIIIDLLIFCFLVSFLSNERVTWNVFFLLRASSKSVHYLGMDVDVYIRIIIIFMVVIVLLEECVLLIFTFQ